MQKLKMQSADITAQNIEKIAALFPNCVTEREHNGKLEQAIDFDLLKQELSRSRCIVKGSQERYQLNWVGKADATVLANTPINKTLRPCREESVNFDSTENLFIEGDNLDALKLLQETYLGKVKMIYIDPPYNTGKDFVYKDKFAISEQEYAKKSGQIDEEGNRLVVNSESNGRFHSDWLSMMYSRLKLARNLLTDDGVIFISIDDNEQANLKRICDEVFGEQNFVDNYVWESTFRPDNSSPLKRSNAENILFYAKAKQNLHRLYGTIEKSEGLPSLTKNSMKVSTLCFKAGVVKTFLPDGIYFAGDKGNGYMLHNDVEVKDGKIITDFMLSGKVIWGQDYLDKELENDTEIIIKSKTFVLYSKKRIQLLHLIRLFPKIE
ncbi:type III restriction-modification system methyltransferase (adenine-specific)/adenine specific DNA methylase Mod [Canicola haemoglobinophilus]|uniref:site-specific DNA-methyltransferase (adenine-specific) n=1 Tax=Canicola haemoglobinophilus TaxID=733 RepID=A0A377HV84_9PAST|nr:site-specific DNA-methyltransferase [Canicola haemoglobinophilus]STO60344.1 type III restriction-modification system methyltransferase (adenine-specific)/adenine specific DNA methylase Mod [Canicola haemoglobinophilus]